MAVRNSVATVLLIGCAAEESLPATGSLRMLSYNVHGLPSGITGDDTPARIAQIAPLIPDYDLLGLQEVWNAEVQTVLTAQCEHPTQEYFDERLDADRAYGAGLNLLGPAPTRLVHEQHYTQCYGLLDGASDCFASKGFQLVRFELGAGSLDVYNSHFEAGSGEEDNAARASNVAELLDAMGELSGTRAILFMGDTNLAGDDPADQPILDALFAAGLEDACDIVGCPEPGRIDRFLLRDGDGMRLTPHDWRVAEGFVDAGGVPLSDHDPIELSIDWEVLVPPDQLPR